jgi:hypothetical protein
MPSQGGHPGNDVFQCDVHCEPSVLGVGKLACRQFEASTLSSSISSAAILSRHGKPSGLQLPVGNLDHIDRYQQAQIARRCRYLPTLGRLEIVAPSGISASRVRCSEIFVRSQPRSRAFTCSSSAVMASFIARNGSSGDGDTSSFGRKRLQCRAGFTGRKSPY